MDLQTLLQGNHDEPFFNYMNDYMIDTPSLLEIDSDTYLDLQGRQLGHKFDGKLDSKNLKVRAKRDKNGECIKYRETQREHFYRIGNLFRWKGPNRNTRFKVRATDFSLENAMAIYGLGMQGRFGDINIRKPSVLDPVGLIKWEAWNNYKGMKITVAREKTINLCEREFRRLGYDYEDPKKPGPKYYEGCWKNKRAEKAADKKQAKLVALEEEADALEIEDQSAIKDESSNTVGIIIILFFLCCISSCIGCCVYVCKKRDENKHIDQVETEGLNVYELQQQENEEKPKPPELKLEDI